MGKVVYVRNSKAKNIDIVGKFKFDPDRDYSKEERFIFYPVRLQLFYYSFIYFENKCNIDFIIFNFIF